MSKNSSSLILTAVSLFFLTIICCNAQPAFRIKKSGVKKLDDNKFVDDIIKKLNEGYNLIAFDTPVYLTDNYLVIHVQKDNISNLQSFYDILINKLKEEQAANVLISCGQLLLNLYDIVGNQDKNGEKLVKYVTKLLLHKDERCREFATNNLIEGKLANSSLYTDLSRKNIYTFFTKYQYVVAQFSFNLSWNGRNPIFLLRNTGNNINTINILKKLKKTQPKHVGLLCDSIMAGLGNGKHLEELIERFENEKDILKRYNLVYALGYTGAKKVMIPLAKALRDPSMVDFDGRPPEMLRLHIAAALGYCAGKDLKFPVSGSYEFFYAEDLEKIEKWAEKVLGVKQLLPKPKFIPLQPVVCE